MATRPHSTQPVPCPCGAGARYQDCCGPLHSGQATATSPEQLMRSRYSAFAVRDEAYLLRSWHPSTRPRALQLDADSRWLGLEILAATDGGAFGTDATVTFRAYYSEGGRPGELREKSRFVRHDGAWVYLDGDVDGGS